MNRNILVIGGRGYVGSALCHCLAAAGFAVGCVDSATGPDDTYGRNYQDLTQAELRAWDTLFLLAGHTSVRACADDPTIAYANNVIAFRNLLNKLAGQRLLFASSASVYGARVHGLAVETDPWSAPLADYDRHKQEIERIAAEQYPEHSYALRFGTVTGPSPVMRGELLVNSFVRTALTEGCVRVANRKKHRAVLGLGDLGRAVVQLVSRAIPPGAYNLASFNTCIGDAADWIAAHFGVPVLDIAQETPYDIQVSTAKWVAASGLPFCETLESLVGDLEDYFRQPKNRTGAKP